MGKLPFVLGARRVEIMVDSSGVCVEPWSTMEKPEFCSFPLLLPLKKAKCCKEAWRHSICLPLDLCFILSVAVALHEELETIEVSS